MEETKKCECGMPLTEETECKCEKGVCIHCCNCEEDCECGCSDKAEKDSDNEIGMCGTSCTTCGHCAEDKECEE